MPSHALLYSVDREEKLLTHPQAAVLPDIIFLRHYDTCVHVTEQLHTLLLDESCGQLEKLQGIFPEVLRLININDLPAFMVLKGGTV